MKQKSFTALVVGVDFSEYSKIVVSEAKQLAEKLKLTLTYVYSCEEDFFYKKQPLPDRYMIVDNFQTRVRNFYDLDIFQKIVIRFGRADKEIIAVAKKELSPIIVVGHKSGHAIAKFFLGSVAENLASSSPFPLWIHRGNRVKLPKKILIPSDLSERSEKTILDVRNFRQTLNSKFEILHVLPHPTPLLDYTLWSTLNEQMKNEDNKKIIRFKKKYPKLQTFRVRGPIIDKINSRSKSFDLIAISPDTKTKSGNRFHGITSKIVQSGDTPILILP